MGDSVSDGLSAKAGDFGVVILDSAAATATHASYGLPHDHRIRWHNGEQRLPACPALRILNHFLAAKIPIAGFIDRIRCLKSRVGRPRPWWPGLSYGRRNFLNLRRIFAK